MSATALVRIAVLLLFVGALLLFIRWRSNTPGNEPGSETLAFFCEGTAYREVYILDETTLARKALVNDHIIVDGWVLACDYVVHPGGVQVIPQATREQVPIIFVETQNIDDATRVLLAIDSPFVLVTADHLDTLGGCTGAFTGNCCEEPHKGLLDAGRLLTWWALNPGIVHAKVRPLPLGPKWEFHHAVPFVEDTDAQVDMFERALAADRGERTKLANVAFGPGSTGSPRVKAHTGNRDDALKSLRSNGILSDSEPSHLSAEDFLAELSHSKFTISPPGNGPDCHRTWEALSAGSIPVTFLYAPLSPLFADIPVVEVSTWDAVTRPFLESKWSELGPAMRNWKGNELKRSHWARRIRESGRVRSSS